MDVKKTLKENNLKITKQRIEILNIIKKEEPSIKEILTKSKVDKSTIYRIIELLLKENIIEKNVNCNDEIYYSIKEHNHYIKCVKCQKKEVIEICPLEIIENKGYKILNHKIEIEGICSKCQTN